VCRAVTCSKCGKTTWAGCGQHVNQVLAGLPASQRCTGHAADPAAGLYPARARDCRPAAGRRPGARDVHRRVADRRLGRPYRPARRRRAPELARA
jgi:hypothetical protein